MLALPHVMMSRAIFSLARDPPYHSHDLSMQCNCHWVICRVRECNKACATSRSRLSDDGTEVDVWQKYILVLQKTRLQPLQKIFTCSMPEQMAGWQAEIVRHLLLELTGLHATRFCSALVRALPGLWEYFRISWCSRSPAPDADGRSAAPA